MNSKSKVLLTIVFLGITAVFLFFKTFYPEQGTETLEFVNATNQPIESIYVPRAFRMLRSGAKEDLVVSAITEIGPGKTKSMVISGPTDAFYSVSVYFSDGSKVEGDAGYVEPNCRVRIIIEKTKITSQIVGKQ